MTKKELMLKLKGENEPLFLSEGDVDIIDRALNIINELEAKVEATYPKDQKLIMTVKANDQRIDEILAKEEIFLTDSAISCKDFFDIPLHFQAIKDNPNYAEVTKEQSYVEGKSIWLEVKVVDSTLTFFLFKWMYGSRTKVFPVKDENIKVESRHTPFGCTLETMSYVPPGADVLKQKMQQLINES